MSQAQVLVPGLFQSSKVSPCSGVIAASLPQHPRIPHAFLNPILAFSGAPLPVRAPPGKGGGRRTHKFAQYWGWERKGGRSECPVWHAPALAMVDSQGTRSPHFSPGNVTQICSAPLTRKRKAEGTKALPGLPLVLSCRAELDERDPWGGHPS